MKKFFLLYSVACLFWVVTPAQAHFGMLLPSEQVVMDARNNTLSVALKFWHPFENKGMDLTRPKAFSVFHQGGNTDLLPALKERKERGKNAWQAHYTLARPGLYAFVMEPQPYWEPAEDRYIIHYTKAYATAFGDDEGWDAPLGLKTEIVPLAKPYALYAGNLFQGRVLLDGKPVPGAEVEVEYYPGSRLTGNAPHAMMVTQGVKADEAGVFSYTIPWSGWWGFSALSASPETLTRSGASKKVELGAVLWLRAYEPVKPAAVKQ